MAIMKEPTAVLIVSSSEKARDYFRGLLPENQFSPVEYCQTAGEAKRKMIDRVFDIVIINTPLKDDFGIEFAIDLSQKEQCGVVLFVRAELFGQVSYKVEDYGILTLQRPNSAAAIYGAVKLLVATRNRLKSLQNKATSLEKKMEEIRYVNRAKLLLMEKLKMTEQEAHRYIEKTAMDLCVKRAQVAKNIINTYES